MNSISQFDKKFELKIELARLVTEDGPGRISSLKCMVLSATGRSLKIFGKMPVFLT